LTGAYSYYILGDVAYGGVIKRSIFSRGFSPSSDSACPAPGVCAGRRNTERYTKERNDIHILDESPIMTYVMTKNVSRVTLFLTFLASFIPIVAITRTGTAKSLYVIANKGILGDPTNPVQAYDIGINGALTFQTQCNIPREMLGAIGMTIDSDAECLFITYDTSNEIHMVDARTMTNMGTVTVGSDYVNLAGIVYDHYKKRLYCAEVGRRLLHVLNWDAQAGTLTALPGSPFTLKKASLYGIALDEKNERLYAANASDTVTVYDTSDWTLKESISLNRPAVSIAVDTKNDFVYTGGGFIDNLYLTQYHRTTSTKREVQADLDAGVMGLAVDPDTGFVYVTTGRNNLPGGDNLLAFDTSLRQIGIVRAIGNPTGLAIPNRDIGYNPFNLSKTITEGAVDSLDDGGVQTVTGGDVLTYAIAFENNDDDPATDVLIVDLLPEGLTFVSADDQRATGRYDPETHSYEWFYSSLEPGSSVTLRLTAQVNDDVQAGEKIVNAAEISSSDMAPATKSVSVEVTNNALNLTKTISGGTDDPIQGVDANEPIFYEIAFDNNGNGFAVTDITVVDYLPDEVTFVSADDGKLSGSYNAHDHTYTWSCPFLRPGEAVSLGLVARVDPKTPTGTLFTNSAVIRSNETPSSMASVDALTYFKPLNLVAHIAGAPDDQTKWVGPKEEIAYTIEFQNRDNGLPVTNVSIVSRLPEHVTFIRARADGDGVTGRYDAKTRSYIWSCASLAPTKLPFSLDLVVEVNKNAPPATILSNSITIDSDQTPPVTKSVDVLTYYQGLSLDANVLGSVIGENEWVDVDSAYAYSICFSNDNDVPVHNVYIVDTLPKEVQFESAYGDGNFGSYDAKTHTYTWSYPSLPPGSSTCLGIVARVNQGTSPSTIITNLVTIDSDETLPTTTSVDAVVGEAALQASEFSVLPEIIRRTGQSYEVQATAILPAGIGRDDIKEVIPTFYPGRIGAKRQIVYGSATKAKVICVFDKNELLSGISNPGPVEVTVVGRLTTGRSWCGRATIYVTEFTGR
jgi:uncharacterized repeat protein (TIGR01451 family)